MDLLGRLLGGDAPPVAVCPAVRADQHSGLDQLADLVGGQPAGFAEASGEHEEFGGEAAFHQPWQGDLDVRGVAVVEGQPDVGSPDD